MLRERFSRPLSEAALALSESTTEDESLLPDDLWGSAAHARMLASVGLLTSATGRRILRTLVEIGEDARKGRFPLARDLEDVHLNVERELTRRLGEHGERLHTGRSRNDQVATDLLLYTRESLLALESDLSELVASLLTVARGPMGRSVVAGWTHMQPAQAVYVAQILGTHAQRFERDAERLSEVRQHIRLSPLGSGAIAGSSLPIDRRLTARLLGFAEPNPSSLDATSDRDVVSETLFQLATFHTHASQLAEELVLGAMPEIGRVELDDAFVTTSSLMPHKRNPDIAELVRAESGPAIGRLVAHLTILKGLPLAYQRDLQAGKPLLVSAVDRAHRVLHALVPMVRTAQFRGVSPASGTSTSSVELADELVRHGVPFRQAHIRVARFVGPLERAGTSLS
ncbi:MAG: argininosuccinate lyase, partial [Thermoplasmata archaeon]|nr:argininosuccinate lyase [Thermoplasmata archaeon]